MMNVTKKYNKGITAINNLSIQIKDGEFVYVVGPSGAGKSTFIKMMYREEKATKGRIRVGKYDLMKIRDRQIPFLRRYVGVVFQDFKLLQHKTVFENVAYAMEVIEKSPREIKRRVEDVLELVNLKHRMNNFPNELSGGEQQRVAIARAIVNTPGILIADEPTGNLDPETSMEIMDILERINEQGTTIVMATHNSQIVNEKKHRVIAIENGQIVRDQEQGNTDMKIRTMGRHIRDAFKSLFRNGLMTFGAVSAVSMILLIVGVFVSLLFNVNKIGSDIENDVNIRVFIDLAADQTKQMN